MKNETILSSMQYHNTLSALGGAAAGGDAKGASIWLLIIKAKWIKSITPSDKYNRTILDHFCVYQLQPDIKGTAIVIIVVSENHLAYRM